MVSGKQLGHGVFVCIIAIGVIGYMSPFTVTVIVGDSMNPVIESHDIVVLDTSEQPDKGDIAAVFLQDGGFSYSVIHKTVKANDTRIVTKGVNNNETDPPADRDSVHGTVVYVLSPPTVAKSVYTPFLADGYAELNQIHRMPYVCIIDSPLGGDLHQNLLHDYCVPDYAQNDKGPAYPR